MYTIRCEPEEVKKMRRPANAEIRSFSDPTMTGPSGSETGHQLQYIIVPAPSVLHRYPHTDTAARLVIRRKGSTREVEEGPGEAGKEELCLNPTILSPIADQDGEDSVATPETRGEDIPAASKKPAASIQEDKGRLSTGSASKDCEDPTAIEVTHEVNKPSVSEPSDYTDGNESKYELCLRPGPLGHNGNHDRGDFAAWPTIKREEAIRNASNEQCLSAPSVGRSSRDQDRRNAPDDRLPLMSSSDSVNKHLSRQGLALKFITSSPSEDRKERLATKKVAQSVSRGQPQLVHIASRERSQRELSRKKEDSRDKSKEQKEILLKPTKHKPDEEQGRREQLKPIAYNPRNRKRSRQLHTRPEADILHDIQKLRHGRGHAREAQQFTHRRVNTEPIPKNARHGSTGSKRFTYPDLVPPPLTFTKRSNSEAHAAAKPAKETQEPAEEGACEHCFRTDCVDAVCLDADYVDYREYWRTFYSQGNLAQFMGEEMDRFLGGIAFGKRPDGKEGGFNGRDGAREYWDNARACLHIDESEE